MRCILPWPLKRGQITDRWDHLPCSGGRKDLSDSCLPSSGPFEPEVVAAQRQDTSDQGCQKIKYLGGEASPASGMEGIKPHLQLLRPWGILIGNDLPYLAGAKMCKFDKIINHKGTLMET